MCSIFVQEELSSKLLQNTNNSNESTLETVQDSSDTHITYDWHSYFPIYHLCSFRSGIIEVQYAQRRNIIQ